MLCQGIQVILSNFDVHGGLDPTLKEFLIKLLLKLLSKKRDHLQKVEDFVGLYY